MVLKFLLSEKQKINPGFFTLLVLSITFLAFFLDVATRNLIAFDIFYFPSILLVTWYLGGRPGFLMVILIAILWSVAQGYEGYAADTRTFLLDGVVHFFIFSLIYALTRRVHAGAALLEQKSRELVRSNLELEQFAFKAAHDLQSPLATLYSYAEYLEEKKENEPNDEKLVLCADAILKSAKRMSLMIKALLDYAKVMKDEKKAPPVDLNRIVRETIENLSATISEKKAQVTADPLPPAAISPGLAGILFQNLIGNAMKYCEKTPCIHVSASRRGGEWVFSVRDNGIGVPQESRERIFIMFEKLPTKLQYPGSGIGLATCQRIVERSGGRIWVEPNADGGSTFYFTLPVS